MTEVLAPTDPREQLKGLKRGTFFQQAWIIASDLILQDPWYENHLKRFGKDREQTAKDAIIRHQFSAVKDPSEYDSLLEIGSRKQNIWRNIALDAFKRGEDLGFTPAEEAVVISGLRIAEITDRVYFAWRESLVNSELGQKFKEMGPEKAAEFLVKKRVNNRYTIPLPGRRGDLSQKAYTDVFLFEYLEIDQELRLLLARLRSLPQHDETIAFIEYFEAYKDAMEEQDPKALRDKWEKVDYAWMEIRGSLQPVHAMEGYMEPSLTRVDPEFRLVVADDTRKAVSGKVTENQQAIIDYSDRNFGQLKTYKASETMLEKSMVVVGTTIAMSGANLDFKIAGQTGPESAEVSLEKGSKIFLDTDTMVERERVMRRIMEGVLGKEFTDDNFVDKDLEIFAGEYVAGHEVAHSLFYTKETKKKMGDTIYALLDETKADIAVLSVLGDNWKKGKVSDDNVQKIMTCIVASGLRDLLYRESPAHKPYYVCAVTEFNLLIESGVLKISDGKWSVDFSNLGKFFSSVEASFKTLATIYEQYDYKEAERFIGKYSGESEHVLSLVSKVKSVAP